jgi:lysozyme
MTLAELRKSRAGWLATRTRARRNHARYVRLTRNTESQPGQERYAFLWARRTYWSRRARRADQMLRTRDRQIRRRTPQELTELGLNFLVAQEGVRRYAYNDSRGFATFGVGHLIGQRPVNDDDRRKWGTPQNPKSMQFVFDVLDRDLDRYEAAVRDAIKVPLSGNQFAACVSLCVNIGTHGFAGSTLARRINARASRSEIAAAFRMWKRPPELGPRREREIKLYFR